MISTEKTVEGYIASLDDQRQPVVTKIDQIITANLKGTISRNMQYGMISYTIPHTVYPAGYHCKPTDDVPFISLASQKNYVSLYHMGLYSDSELLRWLTEAFVRSGLKMDLGKCCLRFKNMDMIPYHIITELISKSSVESYLERYKTLDPRNK